jgi:hypothetical protein
LQLFDDFRNGTVLQAAGVDTNTTRAYGTDLTTQSRTVQFFSKTFTTMSTQFYACGCVPTAKDDAETVAKKEAAIESLLSGKPTLMSSDVFGCTPSSDYKEFCNSYHFNAALDSTQSLVFALADDTKLLQTAGYDWREERVSDDGLSPETFRRTVSCCAQPVSLTLSEKDASSEYSGVAPALNLEGAYSATGEVIQGRPIYFASNLGTDKRGLYLFYWQAGFKWVVASQPPKSGTFAEELDFMKRYSLLTALDGSFLADVINPDLAWEVSERASKLVGADCQDDSSKFIATHAKGGLEELLVDCQDAVYMGCHRPTVLASCPKACGQCIGSKTQCVDNDRILRKLFPALPGITCSYMQGVCHEPEAAKVCPYTCGPPPLLLSLPPPLTPSSSHSLLLSLPPPLTPSRSAPTLAARATIHQLSSARTITRL